MKDGYHVLLLEIINNRTIRAFKAKLAGRHLEVAGKTATGKTTAVSALWEILDPGCDRITHGEKKSIVKVILSDGDTKIRAERKYLPSGSTVSITKFTEDDVEPISAKDFKNMISPLSSNPHKIKLMKDKARVKLLLQSAGIPVEKYENLDEAIEVAATELGAAQSDRKNTAPGDEPEKADAVTAEALSEKITEINDHNQDYDNAGDAWNDASNNTAIVEEENMRLLEKLEDINEEIKSAKLNLKILKDKHEKLVLSKKRESEKEQGLKDKEAKLKAVYDAMERIPNERISEILDESTKINEIATAHKQWEERVELDKAASIRLGSAQSSHKAALKSKKEMMDGAKFPLEGLSIHNGILVYKDVFLDNLGESEQILVLGCLAIDDALSHDIRAVRIDGIESMGQEDYIKLRDYATKRIVQLFTTRVTWDDEIENHEILIVDGYYPEEEKGDE